MASGTFSKEGFRPAARPQANSGALDTIKMILKPVASLRLTVILFGLAIFIVLVGTLAQTEYNIDYVMAKYFRCFLAFIEFKILLPVSWFPSVPAGIREGIELPGGLKITGFPFPGGWAIGAVMLANLFAAHLLKFKIQASGKRLTQGAVLTAIGVAVTIAVICYGSLQSGETSEFFKAWPSMRILTQLVLGTIAGCVMLAGCYLLFKKRAGIVVLHLGVGMIMLNELLVGTMAVEGQMPIDENQTGYWVHDVARSELAIVDTTPEDENTEIVIPQSRLVEGERIKHKDLPFDIEVVTYHGNGMPRDIRPKDKQIATAGRGLEWIGESAVESVGTESEVDRPLAYVTFYEKDTDHKIDTHLVVSHGLLDVVVPPDEIPEKVMSTKLFDVKATAEIKSALDQGSISEELSELLAKHDIEVSNFAFVKVQTPGDKWRLSNGSDVYVLVSSGEKIDVHRTHDVYLRFARRYTEYTVHLIDVTRDNYVGTSTPRNYSSDVRFVDPDAGAEFTSHIWMNNPLRYDGETFYQSGHFPHPVRNVEVTTLQVVSNTGWMIPYVACMIVVVGMTFQFIATVLRFMGGRPASQTQGKAAASRPSSHAAVNSRRSLGWLAIPALIAVVMGAYVVSKARPPKASPNEFNYYEFGKIPITYEGRVKPMDTLARTSLRMIMDRQEFDWSMSDDVIEANWKEIEKDLLKKWPELKKEKLAELKLDRQGLIKYIYEKTTGESFPEDDAESASSDTESPADSDAEKETPAKSRRGTESAARIYTITEYLHKLTIEEGQPASRWLLDLATDPRVAYRHRVIRIDSLEVLDTLGLERRKGFRYSVEEVFPKFSQHMSQLDKARELHSSQLSPYQKKLMELERKIGVIDLLAQTFSLPEFGDERTIQRDLMLAIERQEKLARRQPPLIIPPIEEDGKWDPYQTAWTKDLLTRARGGEGNPAVERMGSILGAYAQGEPREFNREVEKYHKEIRSSAANVDFARIRYESFFNNWTPFYYSMVPYLLSFVVAMLGFMGYAVVEVFDRAQAEAGQSLSIGNQRGAEIMRLFVALTKWTAFGIILVTLMIHTYALFGRMSISGRPPVTNLYSSAVFIGWGCVILGLILEVVFRNGLGNVVSAVMGFATLLIAFLLTTAVPSFKGDSFTVLQAVLDTNFWLATHVTCITLGYSTTFLAGVLGIAMIFVRLPISFIAPPQARKPFMTAMYNMTYGVVCFSILFSFFGTVLGGLWADDSWGRFWGWDPKENGALIIVLWNALLLHARWGGMVKENGFATLAVIGNIVTAWSWFGVNELGVGLHSYGFTEGVKFVLIAFWISQLAIVGYGVLLNFIVPAIDSRHLERPVDAEAV